MAQQRGQVINGAQSEENAEMHRRLVKLYEQLNDELSRLSKEAVELRQDILEAIDKEKMKKILAHITNAKNFYNPE